MQLTYRGINYKPTFLSNTITPSKKGKSVQLTYRGINHEASDSPTNIANEVITGKYRGVPMQLRLSLGVARTQALEKLTYRGVSYIGFR